MEGSCSSSSSSVFWILEHLEFLEGFRNLSSLVQCKLKERSIIIPGQMGIIGFANELFGEHITPSLSTVDQQTIRMGKSALNLLVDIMEKKEQHIKQKVVLDPLLIVRQSSLRSRRVKQ